jgi:ribosomal-protein-alanine N-acetyltransferase
MTGSVRSSGPAEALLLEAIHAAAFDGPWDASWSAGFLAALATPPLGLALIAESDGERAGLFLARLAVPEAEVLAIGVVPAHRRRGIGRHLLAEGLQRLAAAGANTVLLEVAVGNTAAVFLYEGAGFVEIGRRRDYYVTRRLRADALVLRKSLDA